MRRNKNAVIRLFFSLIGIFTIGIFVFLFAYIFWRGKDVISVSFLTEKPSGVPVGTDGGIFPALVGSILSGLLSSVIAGVIGIGTAIYQSFYARKNVFSLVLRASVFALSGIPSIIFGLIAYTLLIYKLGIPRSLLSASIAVAAMMIPFIAIRAEKILCESGKLLMQQSISLGLSKEYSIRRLIFPECVSRLLGATALAMAYGMGAVAPILYTGAVMYADIPSRVTDPFMSLPYHLYMLISNGYSVEYAYGSAFVLMTFLFAVHLLCKGIDRLNQKERTFSND